MTSPCEAARSRRAQAYVHQVVLMANRVMPPELPMQWFIGGLLVFMVAMLGWTFLFVRRFLRVPGGSA